MGCSINLLDYIVAVSVRNENIMTATVGNKYLIKCGWGWTPAILEYTTHDNGKTCYHWRQVGRDFRFVSYDLEDTEEL